jgi:hypothetical protein
MDRASSTNGEKCIYVIDGNARRKETIRTTKIFSLVDNIEMDLRKLLSSCTTGNFSRRFQLHGVR